MSYDDILCIAATLSNARIVIWCHSSIASWDISCVWQRGLCTYMPVRTVLWRCMSTCVLYAVRTGSTVQEYEYAWLRTYVTQYLLAVQLHEYVRTVMNFVLSWILCMPVQFWIQNKLLVPFLVRSPLSYVVLAVQYLNGFTLHNTYWQYSTAPKTFWK